MLFSVTYNKRADFMLIYCLNFGYFNKDLLIIVQKNSVRKEILEQYVLANIRNLD